MRKLFWYTCALIEAYGVALMLSKADVLFLTNDWAHIALGLSAIIAFTLASFMAIALGGDYFEVTV